MCSRLATVLIEQAVVGALGERQRVQGYATHLASASAVSHPRTTRALSFGKGRGKGAAHHRPLHTRKREVMYTNTSQPQWSQCPHHRIPIANCPMDLKPQFVPFLIPEPQGPLASGKGKENRQLITGRWCTTSTTKRTGTLVHYRRALCYPPRLRYVIPPPYAVPR